MPNIIPGTPAMYPDIKTIKNISNGCARTDLEAI